MIFALDKDDGRLIALESDEEAPTHCKAVDVQDGYWLFFAEDGSPLEARFERRGETGPDGSPGRFFLQRAMSGLWLQERLGQVKAVGGCGLTSIDALVETWKSHRQSRRPAG